MATWKDQTGLMVGNKYYMDGHAIGNSPDIFDNPSTAKFAIGTRLVRDDGCVYRYAYSAAGCSRGETVAQDISATGIIDVDNSLVAASAGATQVVLSSSDYSALTADQFAGGYFATTDDAGEGYQYRIRGNSATSSNVTTFYLYEPLQIAVTTATDFEVTGCLWNNVRAWTSTDAFCSGVAVSTAAAADYFWVQTWGVCNVLTSGTTTIGGIMCCAGTGAAGPMAGGSTVVANFWIYPIIGYCNHAGDSTGHTQIMLQIAP